MTTINDRYSYEWYRISTPAYFESGAITNGMKYKTIIVIRDSVDLNFLI